jgi:ligand-binding sensor domain-containing protein
LVSAKQIFLFLFFLYAMSQVQAQDFSMRNFSVRDGLPSSEVYKVVQDKKGYVWFATDAGISRFDGYVFKNFTTDDGLKDNTVLSIYNTTDNKIWFYTWTGHFGYIENDCVYSLEAGDSLKKLRKGGETLVSMAIDGRGEVWIGSLSGEGFYHINPPYKKNNLEKVALPYSCSYISFVGGGNYIFGTHTSAGVPPAFNDKRICVFNGKKNSDTFERRYASGNTFKCFTAGEGKIKCFSPGSEVAFVRGKFTGEKENDQKVISVYVDHKGRLWEGYHLGGLALLRNDSLEELPSKLMNGFSVTSVLQDREEGFWITTLESGVFYLPSLSFLKYDEGYGIGPNKILRVKAFGQDSIVFEANTGDIGTLEKGKYTFYKVRDGDLSYGSCKVRFPDQCVPVSSLASSWLYYYRDVCLKRIMGPRQSPALKSFSAGGQGKILGFMNYIFELDVKTATGDAFLSLDDRMQCALSDESGVIWLGGLGGLWKFQNGSVYYMGKDQLLFRNRIEDMALNKNGLLALATRGTGLVIKNGEQNTLITMKDGLAGNLCKTVVADSAGNFWIGSNRGLSRLVFNSPGDYKIENYSTNEGLISNEINKLAIYGNILWMATNKGLARLDVDKAFVNKTAPLIYITGYSVNSIPRQVERTSSYTYDENYFVIQFTGISFHDFGNVKYKYRMDGLDTSWHYTYNNSIQYTPLQPGNYTFKIYAVNRNGVLSETPAQLSFSISKPLWKEWWFVGALAAALASGIYFFIRKRTREIRKKEMEKTEMHRRIAEMELKALRAQMNPHFIFNSINSIQNFILKNDSENAQRYLSRFSKLIRNVLENSEHEEITIAQEIETLELYLQIEALRFGFKFNYRIIADDNLGKLMKIPAMIIQPYLENAIWHGLMHKEGERNLTLILKRDGDNFVHCTVDDDGIGRKRAAEINSGGNTLHTSMGMQITFDRLEILNKQYGLHTNVIVTDKKNEAGIACGTKVEIFIPVKTQITDYDKIHHH